jgi:hypothetical protein
MNLHREAVMDKRTPMLILAAAGVLAAAPLQAQTGSAIVVPRTQSTLELAPYAGYLLSQDLMSGPLGTRIAVAGGPLYGAQAMLPLLPGIGVVANAAYSASNLKASAPLVGGVDFGRSTTWLYDAGLQIGTGGDRAIAPFVQLGAGMMSRELSVAGFGTRATDFVWNAGLGVDVAVTTAVGFRLFARDYIGKLDYGDIPLLDIRSENMHNIALSAGLKVSF